MKIIVLLLTVFLFSNCEAILIGLSKQKPTIEIKHDKAYVNGVLGKRFYKHFKTFTEENPDIKTIVLEDVPGSANDEWNVKSCLLIHRNGLNTELLASSVIASGGVDLFISGNKRTIAKGAKIGVHSWRGLNKEALDYPRESEEHDIFLDFFDEIKMDTSFYWFTLRAAPADSIHWMTNDEIKQYHLTN